MRCIQMNLSWEMVFPVTVLPFSGYFRDPIDLDLNESSRTRKRPFTLLCQRYALILFCYNQDMELAGSQRELVACSWKLRGSSLFRMNPAERSALTSAPLWISACETWGRNKATPKPEHGAFCVLWDSSLERKFLSWKVLSRAHLDKAISG